MQAKQPVLMSMGLSFGAALAVAIATLALAGANEHGTLLALFLTARVSFVLFWLAYAGSALATLFGPTFQPLKQRGREFGLDFASAHLVHLGLVGWLCWIGAAPGLSVFVFFGIAVVFTYLLALFSIGTLHKALDRRLWWLLRTVGLNFILYAFAKDFYRDPLAQSWKFNLVYLPFFGLCVIGVLLRLVAFLQGLGRRDMTVRAG
ncbi:MAG TPA: hypothetical protein VHB27_20675 [Rhodopila sp.]|uniref:hypothetical protein n=1 Tax=Rhodopila sp. TaxID=2480087 RepID=UPI002B78509B|nr:hypothetical protein [Rhodopila sp.]HVY17646.1 hypothetical protein [Rhodopila sp.]